MRARPLNAGRRSWTVSYTHLDVYKRQIKYSAEGSEIRVTLETNGKYAQLSVQNASDNIPENLDLLFDRFYRAGSSRSRETGGYGIGLSVAKAVANAHRGKISARRLGENAICFEVSLPRLSAQPEK